MFGSNTSTNNNNWGSATSFGRSSSFGGTGSGPLFGNSSSNQPKTTGFGESTSNTTSGGLFGNSSGASNLLGSKTANAVNNNSSIGTGLFGGDSATTNSNSTATGTGLFGNSSTTNNNNSTGTGLFGNSSTNNNNTSTGSGLFGNSGMSNNNSTGTGLFGSTLNNNINSNGGLFGNSNSSNNANSGGLFGANNPSNTSGPSLFGNSNNLNAASGGILGGSKPATGGLFGSSNAQNAPSNNLFGNAGSTDGLFGNNSLQNNTQTVSNNPYGQSQDFASVKYDINSMPNSITENVLKDSRINESTEKKGRFSYLDISKKNNQEKVQPKSSLLSKLGRTFRFFRSSTTESSISITKGLFTPSNFLSSNDKLNVLPKSKNLAPKRISKQAYKSKIVSRDIASIKRLVIKSKPLKYHLIDADKVFNAKKRRILSGVVSSDKLLKDSYSSEESDDEIVPQKKDISLGARFPYKTPGEESQSISEKKSIKILGNENVQNNQEDLNDPDNKDSNNGYWCNPSIKDLSKLSNEQLSNVENFIVGRVGFGQIAYNFPVDLFNISLLAQKNNRELNEELFENIIKIHHKNIQVYADDDSKPPIGFGLNIPATITLEGIKPKDGVSASDYIKFLQSQIGMKFVTYDPITCIWVFKVRHFSIWGLIDDEDEDNKSLVELKRKQDEKEEDATLEYSKIYDNPEVSQELKKLKLSYDTNGLPGTWKYNKFSKESPLNVKRGLLETEINSQITKYKDYKTAIELSANVSDITIESSNASDSEIENAFEEHNFSHKRFDYLKRLVSVLPRNVNINDIVDEKAYEPEISNEAIFDNIKIKPNIPVSDDWLIQLELSNDINSSLNPLVTELSGDNNVSIEKVDDILFSDFNKSISKNQEIAEKKLTLSFEDKDTEIKKESLTNFSKVVFNLISNSDIKVRQNKFPKVASKASNSFSDILSYAPVDIEERQFLELGSALFDDFEISDEYDDLDKSNLNLIGHLKGLQQKKKIERWLQFYNKPTISELLTKHQSDSLETIFVHICAGDLKQAIICAINSNNPHLATIITLLDSDDEAVKAIANNQLVSWEESSISEKIPTVVLKIHQILAGKIVIASEDLPWNVALAIRLYYGDMNLKLFEILDDFFDEINETSSVLDILKSYRLYKTSGPSEALKSISTSNLSLKLKWYFNIVLSVTNDDIDKLLSISFGNTLRKLGMWNEAIFIYAHMQSDSETQKKIREAVIENVLELNVKSDIGDEEEFLITVLKVPNELIYEARAICKAKSGDYWEECEALITARLWDRACKTIVEQLGPACVISDNAILKGRLLNLISKFPDNGLIIPDWNQTANIYAKYIQVSDGLEPDLSILDFLLTNIPLVKDGTSFQSRSAMKIISKKVGEMAIDHSKDLSITKERILSLKLGENELAYFSIRLQ